MDYLLNSLIVSFLHRLVNRDKIRNLRLCIFGFVSKSTKYRRQNRKRYFSSEVSRVQNIEGISNLRISRIKEYKI